MITSKAIKKFVQDLNQTDSYWAERAKLDFALALEKQRKIFGLNYSDLAKKLGTSAAYITKIFRGNTNMTIETLVKLTRATGGRLNIEIINEVASTVQWGRIPLKSGTQRAQVTQYSVTNFQFPSNTASNSTIESNQIAA